MGIEIQYCSCKLTGLMSSMIHRKNHDIDANKCSGSGSEVFQRSD